MNDKSEAGTKPHSFASAPVACDSLGVFLGGHQLLSFSHRLILHSHPFLENHPTPPGFLAISAEKET